MIGKKIFLPPIFLPQVAPGFLVGGLDWREFERICALKLPPSAVCCVLHDAFSFCHPPRFHHSVACC